MKLALKNSMATKLIAMYMASSFIVLASFTLIVQYAIKHHFYAQDYQLLNSKFLTVAATLDDLQSNSSPVLTENFAFLWVINHDGKLTYSNSTLALPPALSVQNALEWKDNGHSYRGFRFKMQHPQYDAIVLAINMDYHKSFINELDIVLLWTFLISNLISGAYAIFTVKKGLSPLQELQSYLDKVSIQHLDVRVPNNKLPVELSQLVATQNKMLDRLQCGFSRLSEFSSDIAHELKTPLTNMMTQTQVALSAARTPVEYQDVLGSNAEEIERLNKTIKDTLYLAKSENQLLHSNKEPLKLTTIIQPLIEFYELLAEDKNVTIDIVELNLTEDGIQLGDKQMLQRAISNILSNALRHCDSNSVITIQLSSDDDYNAIKIINTGEPIPASSLPYLFDRFYRADKSRKHTSSVGAGLGLAITKSIVQAHGGDISVSSIQRVTAFSLMLKKTTAALF
ncbi:heavy metal sensor histidine kinase [Photobacterium sanguinicancri]|uniref:heavy metal sensor histidine kinase n=1 Tax=Photobacterium sanguinicancri TaxID=875932 RepID=UPI0021C2B98E|nr:heavy metal sensor histidine kinase [Photobacterium sanguinicancri]